MQAELLDSTTSCIPSTLNFVCDVDGVQTEISTPSSACDRAWCTAKNLEVWSEMPKMTLWRWLEKLEKARRISLVSDMILVNVPTATGAKSTTFYNLNVLNQLAMVCIDNEKLNEVSCKFSDILSEVETTGSYSVAQTEMSDEKQVVTREFDSLLFRESKAQVMTLISESGLYTLIMRSNKPEAKDVATCIEHSNATIMCDLCRDKDKIVVDVEELKTNDLLVLGNRGLTCISESGLYRILAKCNLPKCEPFENWVFDEVLPSIRKTGSYGMSQISRKDQLFLAIIHSESEEERAGALKELEEINKQKVKALTAERDEAVRTKTQYQSNLAAQMSGRVGGLTTALNRVKLENDRLKGDRLTKEDVYIIMNTQGVSFALKTVKDVIRESLNTVAEYLDEPFPKIKLSERIDANGKTFDVTGFVYTRKTVQVFFEYVENNPMGWQARNRKFILNEWLNHHMTIPV